MTTSGAAPAPASALACVVLAHNDPVQVRRLIDALDPFPVFLHCDRRTPDEVFRAMTDGLPERCVLLPRRATPWARWPAVEAEIAGYRAALAHTDATHVGMFSGSDYPLVSSARIAEYLGAHRGQSIAAFERMPRPAWRGGGIPRLRYRHRAVGRHMIRIPIPRRIPRDVVLAGGTVLKVLARQHVELLVQTYDARPDLVDFWRSSWCADETFVPTVMNTPAFVPNWNDEHIDADLWLIDWLGGGRKSPEWLNISHLPTLQRRSHPATGEPTLFARKFSSTINPDVQDAIDASMRTKSVPA